MQRALSYWLIIFLAFTTFLGTTVITTADWAQAARKKPNYQLVLQILQITPDTIPGHWTIASSPTATNLPNGPAATSAPATTHSAGPSALKITLRIENRSNKNLSNLDFSLRFANGVTGQAQKLLQWLNHEQNSFTKGSFPLSVASETGKMDSLRAQESKVITLSVDQNSMERLNGQDWGAHQVEVYPVGKQLRNLNIWSGRSLLMVRPETDNASKLEKVHLNPILPVTVDSSATAELLTNSQTAAQLTDKEQLAEAKEHLQPDNSISRLPELIQNWKQPVSWLIDPAVISSTSPWQTGKLLPLGRKQTDTQVNTQLVSALKNLPDRVGPKYLDWWGGVAIDRLSSEQIRLSKAWRDRIDQAINGAGTQIAWGNAPVFNENELHALRSARIYSLEPSRFEIDQKLSLLFAEANSTRSFTSAQLLRAVLAQLAKADGASDKVNPPAVTLLLPADTLNQSKWQERLKQLVADPWITVDTSLVGKDHDFPAVTGVRLENDLVADPNPNQAVNIDPKLPTTNNQAAWFFSADDEVETVVWQGKNISLSELSTQVSRFNRRLQLLSSQAFQILQPLNQQALLSYQRYYPNSLTNALWNNLAQQLTKMQKGLDIQVFSQVNLIATQAEIPVKVRNNFPIPLQVEVVLKPLNSRLKAGSTAKVTLAPGSSTTARIPVSAVGNGNVPAELLLRYPQQPARGDTESTPIANIAQDAAIFESVQEADIDTAQSIQPGDQDWLVPHRIVIRIRAAWEDRLFTGFAVAVTIIFIIGLTQAVIRSPRFACNRNGRKPKLDLEEN